eukprot:TRINITY_DN107553_c0_g1_i1.p1 TRINITY_DN107553_c0_g1~~TRINITY_DN107553_c0_g1_i1.p1  ORF type:complete len:102 (-),score=9.29 TRINITY_DN107553_c0_g1_i1:10-315(-)
MNFSADTSDAVLGLLLLLKDKEHQKEKQSDDIASSPTDDKPRKVSRRRNYLSASQKATIQKYATKLADVEFRERMLSDLKNQIGRAVQQECRDRSRMPSSA